MERTAPHEMASYRREVKSLATTSGAPRERQDDEEEVHMKKMIVPAAILMLLALCGVLIVVLSPMRPTYHEWDVAESYACAYRSGQIAIVNARPDAFPNRQTMSEDQEKSCGRFKAIASKHGFNQ